ncbi:MAG: hypothetical protein Q9195_002429 [Heterodermia aff. obscurata]
MPGGTQKWYLETFPEHRHTLTFPQLTHFKGLQVIGGKDCQAVTKTPEHKATFKIGQNITVTALHTPCHTQDSICWFMEDGNDRVVFTGDTLFIGGMSTSSLVAIALSLMTKQGCGRFFEGTPAEMDTALNETLAALPPDTKVYPGHEYTQQNVKFLLKALPKSDHVRELEAFAENNEQTQGKKTIGDEKKYNVFMRLQDPVVQDFTGQKDSVEVMRVLREQKNAG